MRSGNATLLRRWSFAIIAAASAQMSITVAASTAASQAPLPPAPVVIQDPFTVFFDWNEDVLTPEAAGLLNNVAKACAFYRRCMVTISSHADRSGPADYNLALSKRRAAAAKSYLQRARMNGDFSIMSFGETRPVVTTPEGTREAQNRRLDILIDPAVGD